MKKLIVLILLSFLLTGCNTEPNNMEDITIYTSVYPVEFITSTLYKDNATIYSIYPTGVDAFKYKPTNNQIKNYSESGLFIYGGLIKKDDKNIEAQYASQMISNNKQIKIIDASKGMEYNYKVEEIWLNPSNMLMMANNVVSGLNEYISNPYLKRSIKTNYEKLQTELTKLDAEFKDMYENASTKTIVVSNDAFKFLEKYNFNVVSLEDSDDLSTKTISDTRSKILSGQVTHIFIKKGEKLGVTVENIISTTKVKTIEIDMMTSITEVQRENKDDYISIMKENLVLFQQELYK